MANDPRASASYSEVRPERLRRMLAYMLDGNEFFSPYRARPISRYHNDHLIILNLAGQEYLLDFEPEESRSKLFGSNSNWRGPIWLPVNFPILLALKQYHLYDVDAFQVECPTRSGKMMNLSQGPMPDSRGRYKTEPHEDN
jgi:hypothetical protein